VLQHMMGHGLPEPEIANNKQYNDDDTNDRKDVHTTLLWLRGLSFGQDIMRGGYHFSQATAGNSAPRSYQPITKRLCAREELTPAPCRRVPLLQELLRARPLVVAIHLVAHFHPRGCHL
jgi:hypothetical protein